MSIMSAPNIFKTIEKWIFHSTNISFSSILAPRFRNRSHGIYIIMMPMLYHWATEPLTKFIWHASCIRVRISNGDSEFFPWPTLVLRRKHLSQFLYRYLLWTMDGCYDTLILPLINQNRRLNIHLALSSWSRFSPPKEHALQILSRLIWHWNFYCRRRSGFQFVFPTDYSPSLQLFWWSSQMRLLPSNQGTCIPKLWRSGW